MESGNYAELEKLNKLAKPGKEAHLARKMLESGSLCGKGQKQPGDTP
jgi:hypothetical protein